MYYVDQVEKRVKVINFDIISSDVLQDARAAVRGFRFLRQQAFFKEIDKRDRIKEYIVWADTGRHFRNNTVAGYLFQELSQEGIKGKTSWNYII